MSESNLSAIFSEALRPFSAELLVAAELLFGPPRLEKDLHPPQTQVSAEQTVTDDVTQEKPPEVTPAPTETGGGEEELPAVPTSAAMMEAGRRANQAGDFEGAEKIFDECYGQFNVIEAQISAVNMRLKQGRVTMAQKEYEALLLEPQYLSRVAFDIVSKKLAETREILSSLPASTARASSSIIERQGAALDGPVQVAEAAPLQSPFREEYLRTQGIWIAREKESSGDLVPNSSGRNDSMKSQPPPPPRPSTRPPALPKRKPQPPPRDMWM